MTSIDTDEFRTLLEQERNRLHERGRLPARGERRQRSRTSSARSASGGDDNHLGRHGDARPTTASSTRGSRRARSRRSPRSTRRCSDRRRHLRHLRGLRQADRRRAPARDPVGAALHRRPARASVERPAARRPGGLVDERARRRSRSRSARSRAGAWQWAGLVAVALAAVVADQVTKHVVTRTLALDESVHVVGPLSIHHVQNSGIAFGLFSQRDGDRHARDGGGRRLDARLLRALRRAPPGAAGGARPADRRQPLEPRRPDPARTT